MVYWISRHIVKNSQIEPAQMKPDCWQNPRFRTFIAAAYSPHSSVHQMLTTPGLTRGPMRISPVHVWERPLHRSGSARQVEKTGRGKASCPQSWRVGQPKDGPNCQDLKNLLPKTRYETGTNIKYAGNGPFLVAHVKSCARMLYS